MGACKSLSVGWQHRICITSYFFGVLLSCFGVGKFIWSMVKCYWCLSVFPAEWWSLLCHAQFVENTLAPYPGQIGNGEQPALLASNGDGIHSVGATFGPIIERNTLANMGDDAISIHGMFTLVVKVNFSSSGATYLCSTSLNAFESTVLQGQLLSFAGSSWLMHRRVDREVYKGIMLWSVRRLCGTRYS